MGPYLFFGGFIYVMLFIITLMCSRRTLIINTSILTLLACVTLSALNDTQGNSFVLVYAVLPLVYTMPGFLAGAFARLLFLRKKGWMGLPKLRCAIFWLCLLPYPAMVYWFIWPRT
ncbi:hypothetical protein UNDKW_4291 [Undibacterium sp. KW1]|uniref:hypothetical protein n=1 Tax=Undibacterium sp. KW1 TaxID=2058624 RepID=UPI001331F189|nr:hypothetical protein [Undibacterium sp. KW1]BBB62564.1 hypothetical protein UNDKW_4291 [Undibacterium sp. KW1]